MRSVGGCSSPFLRPQPVDKPLKCDAWPVRRQTYGYLPSCKAFSAP